MPSITDLVSAPVSTIDELKKAVSANDSRAVSFETIADNNITKAVGRLREHVFVKGEGLVVTTKDGRQLLDFTSGIGVTSLGHCHPEVTAAIVAQAQSIVHVQCAIAFSEPYVLLVDQLKRMMPSPTLNSFFFASSGSEAIEAAIKVVRTATKRNNIIVMQGGYHGRTCGAAALTRSKTNFFAGTGPLMPCVYTTPFPYWHAMGYPQGTPEEVLVEQAIHQLEQVLQQQTAPTDTAAIFVEPVIGEGGYVPAPPAFLRAIREVCDRHGILMVADEIQSGFGRTGKMFGFEHAAGVVPDLITIAKGFANGMPLAGIVTRKEIMDVMPAGSLGGTYAGNAVACAAALATTRFMERTSLIPQVDVRSRQIFAGLRRMQADDANGGWLIAEVRGLGLMVALEFRDPASKYTREHGQGSSVTLPKYLNKLVQDECYDRGLLVLTTSIYPVLRLIPALVVSEAEVEHCLQTIAQAVKAVAARCRQ